MTVEERLAKLEKTVRLWRIATAALLVISAVLGGGLGMLFFGAPSVLRAKSFHVVNDKGVALELTHTAEGDGLAVFNAGAGAGVPRIRLGTSTKGFGMMELYGGHEQRLISVGGSGSGGLVSIYNNSGKKVVDLQSSKTNSGAVLVNDYDGVFRQGFSGDHH